MPFPFAPVPDPSTGRFELKYQDRVAPDLSPTRVPLPFEVHAAEISIPMAITLNRVKAFVDIATKATTPAPSKKEKIDSEALQISKRSNVFSVIIGFGGRMVPKKTKPGVAGIMQYLNR